MNEIRVIGEIGINANGQINLAKQMIQMAKDCGCHAVKFQKRTVETVYAGQLDAPRDDGNPYGWTTVRDQKHGIEFSWSEYDEIDAFCQSIRMPWFASCWDHESLLIMNERYECPYNKVASAMLTNIQFCMSVADQGKLTFISTGGSDMADIASVVHIFNEASTPYVLMHCVSQYPCPDELLNLNMITTLQKEFPGIDIGYSGHEVGLYPSIIAIGLGVHWIERHITLDRSMYGSDQAASMEPHGLEQLCTVALQAPYILGDGKKTITDGEAACMKKLRYWEKGV